MSYNFFAYLSRMKLINRWSLMRTAIPENVQEHSLQVAVIAHGLALIGNLYFDTKENPAEVALLAIFHDANEVITGDLPTPVKYYNPEIKEAYGRLEDVAKSKLLSMLPPELAGEYEKLLFPTPDRKHALVKAADKISAYVKCLEERMAGNGEFEKAAAGTLLEIEKFYYLPEVEKFMSEYVNSFSLTLDETD